MSTKFWEIDAYENVKHSMVCRVIKETCPEADITITDEMVLLHKFCALHTTKYFLENNDVKHKFMSSSIKHDFEYYEYMVRLLLDHFKREVISLGRKKGFTALKMNLNPDKFIKNDKVSDEYDLIVCELLSKPIILVRR